MITKKRNSVVSNFPNTRLNKICNFMLLNL